MFNGIWLVATEPLTMKGRVIKVGERFHISRVHSGALLVTGRATIAHPQPPPKSRVPEPPPVATSPRRRGRPRKTESAEPTKPVAPPANAEPPDPADAPATPEPIADPPDTPDDTDTIETPQRHYQRRDLEAEP